jgi:hypothetical protein
MRLYTAILLTLCIYFTNAILLGCGHYVIAYSIAFGTTLWAAIDSSKIELKRYRNGVGPVAFFFLCWMAWMIGFPWYLWMRHKILTGKAELKTDDPRCVRCDEIIDPALEDCPKCGWRQPK